MAARVINAQDLSARSRVRETGVVLVAHRCTGIRANGANGSAVHGDGEPLIRGRVARGLLARSRRGIALKRIDGLITREVLYLQSGQRSYVANDTFVVRPVPSSRMYITAIVLPSGDSTFVNTCVTLPSFLLMISLIRSLI